MDFLSSQEPQHSAEPQPTDDRFLQEISTVTLARLLIRKGLITPAELLNEERQNRQENAEIGDIRRRRGHLKLRRWAAKRRWSRKLTHLLFGWQWRRSQQPYNSVPFTTGHGNSSHE